MTANDETRNRDITDKLIKKIADTIKNVSVDAHKVVLGVKCTVFGKLDIKHNLNVATKIMRH